MADSTLSWGAWSEAKRASDEGRWDDAIRLLKASPSEEAGYFFNLGLLFQKKEKPGAALAYFEKASLLDPQNPQITHALQIARKQFSAALGDRSLDPTATALEQLAMQLPLDVASAALGFTAAVLSATLFKRKPDMPSVFHRKITVISLLVLGAGSLFFVDYLSRTKPIAACVEAVLVKSGPGSSYLDLGALEVGIHVRLTPLSENSSQDHTPWRQIRWQGGSFGWVPESSLLLLSP